MLYTSTQLRKVGLHVEHPPILSGCINNQYPKLKIYMCVTLCVCVYQMHFVCVCVYICQIHFVCVYRMYFVCKVPDPGPPTRHFFSELLTSVCTPGVH